MSKKVILVSLVTSAFMNLSHGLVEKFKSTTVLSDSSQKLEIIPVKFTDKDSKHCLNFKNTKLLPLSRRPIVSVEGFQYQGVVDEKLGLKFLVDDHISKDISKKYMHQQLAIVLNGKVISTSRLTSESNDQQVGLKLNAQSSLEKVIDELKLS